MFMSYFVYALLNTNSLNSYQAHNTFLLSQMQVYQQHFFIEIVNIQLSQT